MENLKRTLLRHLLFMALVGLGLAVAAGTAHAQPIVFEVDESAVPDANDEQFDADGITGKYQELLVLNPDGTFEGFIVVVFTSYTLDGNPVTDQIGASDPADDPNNFYVLYALVTASGTFESTTLASGNEIIEFFPTDSTADIWIDPDRDTTFDFATASTTGGDGEDLHILTASTLNTILSIGSVLLNEDGDLLTGSYALHYTDPMLVDPDGPLYWPGLVGLTLFATASGDVDPASEGSVFPTDIQGDTSISFQQVQVPEPASLLLVGLGLCGAAVVARRRRRIG